MIHGTGAGRRTDTANGAERRWWELGSTFAIRLIRELASRGRSCTPDDSFIWGDGGANSETARRNGGRDLTRMLRALDADDRKYHLVGHSHGGSVIWHCLTESARAGGLKGLMSWTTVGTPFLRFRPSIASLWAVAPALLAAGTIIWLNGQHPDALASTRASMEWSEHWVPLAALALLGLIVGGALAAGTLTGLAYLYWVLKTLLRERREKLAASLYFDRYCCLFHPMDEPLNGLSITRLRPSDILPRPATKGRGLVAFAWKCIAELWSRPADDLTWDTIAKHLQGNDLPIGRLVDVGALPLGNNLPSGAFLPAELLEIEQAADERSADMMRDARHILADLAHTQDGSVRLQNLAHVVDWSGVIHTSYFDRPSTCERIANQVEKQIAADGPKEAGSTYQMSVHRRRNLFKPTGLILMKLLVSIGALGGIIVTANLLYLLSIQPFSRENIGERIVAQLSDPLLSNVADSDLPGHLALRLTQLPEKDLPKTWTDPIGILLDLPDERTRLRSAEIFAYWYGSNAGLDSFQSLDDLVGRFRTRDGADQSAVGQLLELYGVFGLVQRGRYFNLEQSEVEDRFRKLLASPILGDAARRTLATRSIVILVADALGLTGDVSDYIELQEGSPLGCSNRLRIAAALVAAGNPGLAASISIKCTATLTSQAALFLGTQGRHRDVDAGAESALVLAAVQTGDAAKATASGNGVQGSDPDVDIPAATDRLLQLAIFQAQDEWHPASRLLDQIEMNVEWRAVLKLTAGRAVSWARVAEAFRQHGDEASQKKMMEMLTEDYSNVVLSGPSVTLSVGEIQDLFELLEGLPDEGALSELAGKWYEKASEDFAERPAMAAATFAFAGIGFVTSGDNANALESFRQAGDLLDHFPIAEERASLATAIAVKSAVFDDRNFRAATIQNAYQYAVREQDPARRAAHLNALAILGADLGNYPRALEYLSSIDDPAVRYETLISICEHLFLTGDDRDTGLSSRPPGLYQVPTIWPFKLPNMPA
ncbi:alpha/beta hydrolase [Mesorhizobium sp. B2-8-9]|uniref:alpha/beta hydrolase n=1 Tax=Mesorhizobium sp. B2-8-9 TaxID=2589899 RepID=UPI00112D776D|nr:alpha/beta hydrolase [Mesorhizobium sp. B2-8-9]TPI78497.1 alpha/beta hydrolase [Mesorhizobium sp. B2-8-9]